MMIQVEWPKLSGYRRWTTCVLCQFLILVNSEGFAYLAHISSSETEDFTD